MTTDATPGRPRCAVFIATSLDGFIARADGSIDWLAAVERPGEDYGIAKFYGSVDTLVMGRKSWETALGFAEWPYANMRVVVMSRHPREARHGETFHAGPAAELVAALGRDGARRVYVDGGETIRAFLAAGLVDELTVSVIPVLLGAGVPLFGDGVPETRLTLRESRAYESGLVQSRYDVGPR
jgi:dihydrofolate reductase